MINLTAGAYALLTIASGCSIYFYTSQFRSWSIDANALAI